MKGMSKIIISLGGSVIYPKKVEIKKIKNIAKVLYESKHQFGIVVGGGQPSKDYYEQCLKYTSEPRILRDLVTYTTRANASLFLGELFNKKAQTYPKIPVDVIDAKDKLRLYRQVVMGSNKLGQSTDIIAVKLAIETKSNKMIKITNVKGVFDKDPSKTKKTKKIDNITHKELIRLLGKKSIDPRVNTLIDPRAVELCYKNHITIHIIKGNDIESLKNIIDDKPHNGTVVEA